MPVYVPMLILAGWIAARTFLHPAKPRWVIISAQIVFFLALFSPLYYEFPGGQGSSSVVAFHGREVTPRPFGMFAWEFGGGYANMPTSLQVIGSAVSVVTDNPKVRKVSYVVAAEITSPEKFYSEASGRRDLPACYSGGDGVAKATTDLRGHCIEVEIRRLVSFHLYRFNADKSKELLPFDNPLDRGQVIKMKQLLEGYLNPRLGDQGLAASFQGFGVD